MDEALTPEGLERLAALRYKSIVERVLTAPYRGCAVIEVHMETFIKNAEALGVHVEWGVPDVFGFMAPVMVPLDSGTTETATIPAVEEA